MKIFRKVDLVIQAALMISFFPAWLFSASIPIAVALGVWQLFSFLLTRYLDKQPLRQQARTIYITAVGLLALPALCMYAFNFPPAGQEYVSYFFFAVPIMAASYFYICCREFATWQHRSLIQFR